MVKLKISQHQIAILGDQSKKETEQVVAFDDDISRWKKEIQELQSKIEDAQRKKAEVQVSVSSSLKAQMEEKTKEAINHLNNVNKQEAELEELVKTETFINSRMKHAKTIFDRLKSNLNL